MSFWCSMLRSWRQQQPAKCSLDSGRSGQKKQRVRGSLPLSLRVHTAMTGLVAAVVGESREPTSIQATHDDIRTDSNQAELDTSGKTFGVLMVWFMSDSLTRNCQPCLVARLVITLMLDLGRASRWQMGGCSRHTTSEPASCSNRMTGY